MMMMTKMSKVTNFLNLMVNILLIMLKTKTFIDIIDIIEDYVTKELELDINNKTNEGEYIIFYYNIHLIYKLMNSFFF